MTNAFVRNYIRDVVLIYLLLLAILLLISLGGRFSAYIADAAQGRLDATFLLTLLLLRLPEFLTVLTPLCLFLAIAVAVGQRSADDELTVLVAAGLHPAKLIEWSALVVMPLVLVVGVCTLWLVPTSKSVLHDVLIHAKATDSLSAIETNQLLSLGDSNRALVVQGFDSDSGTIEGVTFAQHSGAEAEVFSAARGSVQDSSETGERQLILHEGSYVRMGSNGYTQRRIQFGELSILLNRTMPVADIDLESLPTSSLSWSKATEAAELHWRLALPIVILVVSLAAVGLSRTSPRQGRFSKLLPCIAFFLAYFGATLGGKAILTSNLVPALVGLWPIHIAFGGAALYFYGVSWQPR